MFSGEISVKVNSQPMGVGFVLFVVFLVLKLVGVISWSWWWVTAPLWGAFALALVLTIVVVIFAAIVLRK
jgi:hypothetical protein